MSTLQAVELGVLGPLQVRRDGAPVTILIELLWGDDPPRTAAKALQTHISSLRRTLGDGFVLTEGTGWILVDSEVDASRYKLATRTGRDGAAAGEINQAVARFDEALALWRGIPELPDGRRGTSEKTRWIEGHAALVEQVVTSRAGRLIKTRGEGDATFSVFDRPSAAAAAAIELQDAIFHEPWLLAEPMRIRVALHTGGVELRDGDYFGRAVNRAARLRSLAVLRRRLGPRPLW